jgi:hypothetical protein
VVAGLVGRKADAFAALLEGKAPAASDPNLAQLANIASRLSTVPQPTAAFRSTLRDQLMATAGHGAAAPHAAAPHAATTQAPATQAPAAHTPTVPAPRVSPSQLGHGVSSGSTAGSSGFSSSLTSGLASLGKSAPVWAKVFAGVAAVSVSATGVAVGAVRALPGDVFYGVKKQVEAVQLDLASGAHGKAIAEFGFAQARINELNKLLAREHVVAGQPVSKDTAAHIKDLLENWAENTGVATTSLIQQIQALGSGSSTAARSVELRNQLSSFTSQQFESVGKLLGDMPTSSLQSLTVSALGYLQRVDAVLGHDPAALISKLPVSLNSVPGVSKVLPRLVLPSNIPTTGGKVVLPGPSALQSLVPGVNGLLNGVAPGLLPTDVPKIALPSTGTGIALPSAGTGIKLPSVGTVVPSVVAQLPSLVPALGSILPALPGVIGQLPGLTYPAAPTTGQGGPAKNLPGAVQSPASPLGQAPAAVKSIAGAVKSAGAAVGGQLPSAVQSATGNAGKSVAGAVTGTLGAITGGIASSAGPSLPLPVSLPLLPALPKLPGLH